jgi:hypothetical protein
MKENDPLKKKDEQNPPMVHEAQSTSESGGTFFAI